MTTFGFDGLYQFEKFRVDADGNELPGTREIISPWQGNLITDAGLNYLGSTTQDNLAMCRIGTGNAAPANSDTALGEQVGQTTTAASGGGSGYNATDRFVWRRVAYRFAAGTISGVNLAEVGMAANNSVSLFSRSLIKDSGGIPTTLTLAADEVLDVLYELRLYLPAQDIAVPATIDGAANTVTIRVSENEADLAGWGSKIGNRMVPGEVYYNSSRYGCVIENPLTAGTTASSVSQSAGTGVSVALASYTSNSFTTTATVSVGLTGGNYTTGIGALLMSADGSDATAYGLWQYIFATKLNKSSVRTATITVGVTWGRYTP